MQTHRQIAKRKTVLWQAAAVGILLAAGAAIALPSIDHLLATNTDPKPKDPPVVPPLARPDYSVLPFQQALNGSKNAGVAVAPKPPEKPVDDPDPTAIVNSGPPVAPASATEWAYIGSIITSNARHALVKIDGNQEIYSIGDTHNNTKLVDIERDHIDVEVSGVKHTIQLAERQLLAPTDPPKRPVAFRPAPNLPGAPGAPGGAMVMAGRMADSPGLRSEQARAAAAAAAEAAARARVPSDIPGMIPLEKIDAEEMQMAQKALSDVNMDNEARLKYLQVIGIGPGTPIDSALVRAKEAGLDLGSEAGKHIINAIESNAKRGK